MQDPEHQFEGYASMSVCVCVYIYIYIYMHVERERERDDSMCENHQPDKHHAYRASMMGLSFGLH